jgi:uncharacterized linocin/CFP29 family protein
MDHLRRSLAPITDAAWEQVDHEARRTLGHFLAARKIVDFSGPHGWAYSAVPSGRIRPAVPPPVEGVIPDLRAVQPLLELRTPFGLALAELDAVDRGAPDPDLSPLVDAAQRAALAEDRVVFHGHEGAGIEGVAPASPHVPLDIGGDYHEYPGVVARAVAMLRRAGVEGPYAIALGPRCYTGVIETTEHGGYPVLEHLRMILGGPVVWAPAVDGAVVVSTRGGDYELVCGQDFAIGFHAQVDEVVELFFEESLTLVVREPRAAVALRYDS